MMQWHDQDMKTPNMIWHFMGPLGDVHYVKYRTQIKCYIASNKMATVFPMLYIPPIFYLKSENTHSQKIINIIKHGNIKKGFTSQDLGLNRFGDI